jgi:hypothetical protein
VEPRTETEPREETHQAANRLKNRMETEDLEETRQAANHLKSRITTTDKNAEMQRAFTGPLFRTDDRVNKTPLCRYFQHNEKYFYFFVKYI